MQVSRMKRGAWSQDGRPCNRTEDPGHRRRLWRAGALWRRQCCKAEALRVQGVRGSTGAAGKATPFRSSRPSALALVLLSGSGLPCCSWYSVPSCSPWGPAAQREGELGPCTPVLASGNGSPPPGDAEPGQVARGSLPLGMGCAWEQAEAEMGPQQAQGRS